MFGVGKVARRRDDGVTEVLIASASVTIVRAFFQRVDHLHMRACGSFAYI